ncbi:MAG: 30S ribosomal protein S21 [Spirochaetia bacterium]|nr:30S ribosomal protein S21 [Spirochaetia bacterium]
MAERRKITDIYEYFNNGVTLRENEPPEIALKRFKREVINAGTLTELKKREFFEKPSVIKRRAKEAAIRKRDRKKTLYGDS